MQTVHKIEVHDLLSFAKIYPDLVRIEVKLRDAEAAVKSGRIPIDRNPIFTSSKSDKAVVR